MTTRVLGADRFSRPEHSPEFEYVRVDVDGDVVSLVLDDGERLTFDVTELRAALDETQAA